jgi:RNA polymerase sigma-54 factor
MRMEISIGARLQQKLKLAPQIIQSIEILQMNVTDLRQHVEEQMLENPTMELEDPQLVVADTSNETDTIEEKPDMAEESENSPEALERELERLESIQESWKELADVGRRSYSGGDKDKKMEAMQNAPERDETLQEHVNSQFAIHPLVDDRGMAIGEYLAYNLDDNGYLKTQTNVSPIAVSATNESGLELGRCGEITEEFCAGIPIEPPATPEETEAILHIIQQMDPPGVGARDLKECLLIQIGMAEEYALERQIVRDHLEDIMMNRIPKIAKVTGEPLELIDESLRYIRMLNPQPGAVFAKGQTQYVSPDITVSQDGAEWIVRLEDYYVPQIRISPQYRNMLEHQGDDPKVVSYVKKKIESARWLMEAIEQRQQTLRKIAQEIVDYQMNFFEEGVDALRPLKMEYIAQKVGVHVSTVSRAISGKYMQTPRGIFSLKYFFKGGKELADGSMISVVAIKEKIKTLVEKEDKSSPLSDEEISNRLQSGGLDVKRRTITKYRKQLNIPSSRKRRLFV